MESKGFQKKLHKKLKRHQHTVSKETGVVCTDLSTKHLALCNVGQINGLNEEVIIESFSGFGGIERVLLIPGKSCSFISFTQQTCAEQAFVQTNGQLKIAQDGKPVFISFVEQLPQVQDDKVWDECPSGLEIIPDFITPDEELKLLNLHKFDQNDASMKHRQVKHFGFEFRYDINNVDKDKPLPEPIPSECDFLFTRLPRQFSNFRPDQLTINQYRPGQGIPPHIDTHSAFESPILSLSLGSDSVMEFRKNDKTVGVFLPRRSLAIMSDEARYDWSHGITPKTFDFYYNENGCVSFRRGTRVSYTFRKVLQGECRCCYKLNCDSYKKNSEISGELAAKLENQHVHDVYEEISGHFSETRHKPWPNVVEFLKGFEIGAVLVDVGCGNGKYFGCNPDVFQIGTDRSIKLSELCHERNNSSETFTGNCLYLPLRDNIADGVISIAVIHHLSTSQRRLQAVSEIVRILKTNGQALIYVWAKNQVKNNEKSTYIKQDRKNRKNTEQIAKTNQELFVSDNISLPVHTNRTDFSHSDLLVPWKLKNENSSAQSQTFLRYYHVFDDGELELLCNGLDNVVVRKSFYDQGNCCVIIEKI